MSVPRPRSRRRGIASFDHIGRISRGGPGSAIATPPSGRLTNQPGALPFGFGSGSLDGMRQACLRLISGNGRPRRSQRPRSQASRSGSTSGVSPSAAAIDSRVRSSGVGPSPPVLSTRSARRKAVVKASVTTSSRSGRATILPTVTPSSVSASCQLAGIGVAGLADGQLRPDAEDLGRAEMTALGRRWHDRSVTVP